MKKIGCIVLSFLLIITPALFTKESLSTEEIDLFTKGYQEFSTTEEVTLEVTPQKAEQELREKSTETEPFSTNHAVYVDGSLLFLGELALLYQYHFSKYFSVIGGVATMASTELELLGVAIGINMTTHRDKPGPEFYIDLLLDNYFFQFSPVEGESQWTYVPLPKLIMGVEFISREGLLLRLGVGAYPFLMSNEGSTSLIPVPFLNTSFGYAW